MHVLRPLILVLISALSASPTDRAHATDIYLCRNMNGSLVFQQLVCTPAQTEAFRGNYSENIDLEAERDRRMRLYRALKPYEHRRAGRYEAYRPNRHERYLGR